MIHSNKTLKNCPDCRNIDCTCPKQIGANSPMPTKSLKESLDEVYAIGFKNGQIEMRNRVLMKLNRDMNFWTSKNNADFLMTLLKKINKLPLTKKLTKVK